VNRTVIKVSNLNYAYPDGKQALKNVSMEIEEGECVGIIGPNGAGKSTLLLNLNGILRGKGLIEVCGLEMNDANVAEIRKKVGLVFQNPDHQLFMPTVFEDVAFGPMNLNYSKEEINWMVEKALREVDGFDFVQRASFHLSVGEKKRVSIATVLSMKPSVIAFDEPSGNLDPKHRRELIGFLKKSELTRVITSHDLDFVLEVCSRVILLDRGEIAAAGSSLEILGDQKLLETHDLEIPYSLKSSMKTKGRPPMP
jgi:cobalt/nickel transport system ATP-binding protein